MFDVEFVVPVCGRFSSRLADFKKYGLVNPDGRSVLLNLLVSKETIHGLDSGWPSGFSVRVIENDSPNFIGNLYRFYADIDPSSLNSRWLVRLDDDSCTDVDGLVSNLDDFYDHSKPYYLGDLNAFRSARAMGEAGPYEHYKSILGKYEPISSHMQNEVECGVMSVAAVEAMLKNPASMDLIRNRSTIEGGFGDCVVALASALAKVWPAQCPFITHLPLVHEFSLLGGFRNHIHGIERIESNKSSQGKAIPEAFQLVAKVVDGSPSGVENSMLGKRFLIEGEKSMRIVEFSSGYRAKVKPDHRSFHWFERSGQIVLLADGSVSDILNIDNVGNPHCEGFIVKQI
jgi:hypothetical protein